MTDEPQKRRGRPKGSPNVAHRDVAMRVGRIMAERSLPMIEALAVVAQDEGAPVMHRWIAAQQVGLQMQAYIVRPGAIDT